MKIGKLSNNSVVRDSNIELLRIIAMFMILIRHAGFYAIGTPVDNTSLTEGETLFLTCCECFCSVGVNVFILISGYFSIKYNARSVIKFIFQCLFYSCGIYLTLYFAGIIKFSILGLSECLYLRKINWFPKAYLCLFILAPILNKFVEHSNRNELKKILLAFFVFQTIFGCISDATHFISFGYSTISFIGLYLLGRYYRIYDFNIFHEDKNYSKILNGRWVNISIYLAISTVLSIVGYIFIVRGYYSAFYRLDAYCDPIVIISSLSLFIAFTKFKFNSKFINTIAASCFAVYLFHSNPNVIERFYTSIIRSLHLQYGKSSLLLILAFICVVFVIAILIDKIRILIWNVIDKRLIRK